jgi:hypothetical protein
LSASSGGDLPFWFDIVAMQGARLVNGGMILVRTFATAHHSCDDLLPDPHLRARQKH